MPLTHLKVERAKPKEKQYKLADERGMYLLVHPKGGKWWRFDYRYGGKRKTLSLGIYPDVSIFSICSTQYTSNRYGSSSLLKLMVSCFRSSHQSSWANAGTDVMAQKHNKEAPNRPVILLNETSSFSNASPIFPTRRFHILVHTSCIQQNTLYPFSFAVGTMGIKKSVNHSRRLFIA